MRISPLRLGQLTARAQLLLHGPVSERTARRGELLYKAYLAAVLGFASYKTLKEY